MNKTLKTIFKPKKVELSDVASPQPSRAASKVINGAIKRAHADQQATTSKAEALRGN